MKHNFGSFYGYCSLVPYRGIELPGFPHIVMRVQKVLGDETADAARIIRVLGSEPVLASQIVRMARIPVGVNALRNDAQAAMAIATATEADFIRVNVHMGTVVSDQGIIQGIAHGPDHRGWT